MNAAALVFLKDDKAKALAVAWSQLGKDKGDVAWGAAAGVDVFWVRRLGPMLRANGICTATGTDDLALRFIAAEMTKGIKRKKANE